MSNAYALNFTLNTTGDQFSAIWKLTRALISSGWKYKASGNGQSSGSKDTSGNPSLDLWGVDGAINLQNSGRASGSGTGVSIAAASASTGLAVVSGLSGATSASVGCYLTVSGSAAGNNGSFRITAQTGTTVTVYAPQYAVESSNSSLVAAEQYGGADGSITGFSSVTSGQSTLINFTTSSFTGFTTTDIGRCISILNSASGNNGTYLIAGFVSSSNVLLYGPSMTHSDAENPTIQWVEYAPLNQIYPSYLQAANGSGAWINLQGPTIMKIPIGNNSPTGTFVRGENITQTTTGAQGEILGVNLDTSGGTGYLVVAPRVIGTGVQASSVATYGWNSSANVDTITGAISNATINTPVSSTPIAYISEMVIWKNNSTQGLMQHQRIDQNSSTESATTATTGRFSTMATSATVTSVLCPGGSTGGNPTTNGFPTVGSYAVSGGVGLGGISTTSEFACWSVTLPTTPGKAHLIAANNVEQQSVSADGTWLYLQSCNSVGYQCVSYLRMDNIEDGDLDPYVHQGPWTGALNASPNRISDSPGANGGSGSATDNMNGTNAWFSSSSDHGFKGFRRRGQSGETFNWFSIAFLYDLGNSSNLLTVNSGNPDQVGTAIATTYVRDQIWCYLTPFTAQLASGRMRKGTPRWLQMCQGGSVNSTFDAEEWIILSSSSTGAQFVVGPWDGATTPSF